MKIKTKHILLIVLLAGLTFSNTLGNGFVGDDKLLFVENSFYKSWENFPRLFDPTYSSQWETVFNRTQEDLGSGSVAYRPALSTTFFIDYGLWGENPFGFHLTSLAIHIINCLLVYAVFLRILPSASLSLLAAVIFAVHPLKTEAVAGIGYRADILSTLFVLAAFRLYVSVSGGKEFLRRAGVHVFFVLALFSKESAAVFPFLCLAYDHFIRKEPLRQMFRHSRRYAGFFLILAAYAYLYLYVFTNKAVVFKYLEGSLLNHVLVMVQIFSGYLIAAFVPFTVKAMPPVYHPPLSLYHGVSPAFSTAVMLFFTVACIEILRRSRLLFFWTAWFLLAFLPVSNIIPVPNPMAYRFMYLPSVGLAVLLAYLLEWLCSLPPVRRQERAALILKSGLIGCMMIYTFLLNFAWKSGYTMAANMARDFPHSGQGDMFLGMAYCQGMDIDKAQEHLRQAYEKGLDDPRLFFAMGFCRRSGIEEAERLYKLSIERFPEYVMSYVGLARIYFFDGRHDEALELLAPVLDRGGTYSAFGYAIQIHMMRAEKDKARELLDKARQRLTEKGHIQSLERMLASDPSVFPADIGL